MADSYERDKEGNIIGKAVQPHPQEPSEPSPSINSRPSDVPSHNSTFADRAKGSTPKPVARPESAAHNSTLTERTKAASKRGRKAVQSDDAENKAVSKAAQK